MNRISNYIHPDVYLEAGDTVIFSSKIIPGNEKKLYNLHNKLVREGIEVISEENIKLLKSTSPLKINNIGKGKVIYLTDNTNFRAFWYGTNKILMNAIFFSNIM